MYTTSDRRSDIRMINVNFKNIKKQKQHLDEFRQLKICNITLEIKCTHINTTKNAQ